MGTILKKHADLVMELANPKFKVKSEYMPLLHAAMGLVTESAEIMDAIRKAAQTDKPVDEVNLWEEGGDILFYLQMLAAYLGASVPDLAWTNMAKLRKRYPDGFSVDNFEHRNLAAERKVLESESEREGDV